MNNLSIINSFSVGDVNGYGKGIGGFVGSSSNHLSISKSHSARSVSGGEDNVGGFVGYSSSPSIISNSYSTGSASGGEENIGGFVGSSFHSLTIENSYSTGKVNGNVQSMGGLVGHVYEEPINIINSFYDIEMSGQSDIGKGIGKTTTEMKTSSTFSSWDKNIWNISEGYYPNLKVGKKKFFERVYKCVKF